MKSGAAHHQLVLVAGARSSSSGRAAALPPSRLLLAVLLVCLAGAERGEGQAAGESGRLAVDVGVILDRTTWLGTSAGRAWSWCSRTSTPTRRARATAQGSGCTSGTPAPAPSTPRRQVSPASRDHTHILLLPYSFRPLCQPLHGTLAWQFIKRVRTELACVCWQCERFTDREFFFLFCSDIL